MQSHRLQILNALDEQTKTGHLCDVLFYNNSGSVWAHSCVLAGFSSIFDQMFSQNLKNSHHWSLKQPIQITLSDTSVCQPEAITDCIQCLAQVIKFIYTGQIKLNALHFDHLILLSERLGNDELSKVCKVYQNEDPPTSVETARENPIQIKDTDEERTKESASLPMDGCTIPQKSDNAARSRENEKLNIYDCHVCHFVSNNLSQYKIHGKIFHFCSYKCYYCSCSYKSISLLLHHMKNECKSDNQVICSICLFESSSPIDLLVHLNDHYNEKPFLCSMCKRNFDKRSVWLKHLKTHKLNTMHHCPTCNTTFKTAAECSKHIKGVHAPKKHVCDTCGFSAAFPHLLENHLLKHRKVITCKQPHCNFQTSSESVLIRHQSVHRIKKSRKTDKNHECLTCHMKFTLHKNLTRHLKIHESNESKMICPLCSYETSRTDKFNDHMELKHDRLQIQRERIGTIQEIETACPSSNQDETQICTNEGQQSNCITKSQNSPRETYSVESFSNKHNTLLMNDEGDISIVNTNEKNSVTLRNIGNLTGSITLDEKTGVLTMNNINSGSVFLNETTGELTYINLENDNYHFNPESIAPGDNFKTPTIANLATELTKLDEVTGEIIKFSPSNEEAVAPEQDYDYFDMDINEDSLDGFDDFDEVLFDVFTDNGPEFDGEVSLRDPSLLNVSVMPHLDESTGLLTFDENFRNTVADHKTWDGSFSHGIEDTANGEEAYKLLLDEVTGVLHD